MMAERPIGDDYRGTLRRAWDRAAGTDPIDPPTPARPVELDTAADVPGMAEKARAAFEAMTKAMLDAGRRYEERMNAATTAALSAALARATSAEQERDRLRAGIEAALAECDRADEGLARQSRTGATFVHERMRALLAGLGEQPGEVTRVEVRGRGYGKTQAMAERVADAVKARGLPAEVLPAPAPVAPDSTDVYETIRAFIEEEVGFDGGPGMDDQARRLTDRVLAVVGQGVTAEEGGWEVSALLSDDRYRVKRTAGGWLVLTRSDRAVVRSGEQGGEGA